MNTLFREGAIGAVHIDAQSDPVRICFIDIP